MAKKLSFREDDKEMPPKKGLPTKDDSSDGAVPDHADEDQDKALFSKMIKQYLGKDDADESEVEMAHQAYQAHKEAGMHHDEAFEAAGKHLKMAAEIGKKMHQAMMKASEKKESEGESESESESESECECGKKEKKHESEGESESESESEDEKKESQTPPDGLKAGKKEKKHESASVAKLAGEVAKLRESIRVYEVQNYLDSKLKKSGESNQCTKLFREALGKPRSSQHVDETWNTFIKAYKAGAEEVGSDDALFMEKTAYRAGSSEKKSLADCIR